MEIKSSFNEALDFVKALEHKGGQKAVWDALKFLAAAIDKGSVTSARNHMASQGIVPLGL
jgi:hypothetical protein